MGSRTIRPVPPLEEVKRELRAICESPTFSHSTRQCRFLEYLCNKVLLGEAEQIKAATIAMEVFGRPWDFDESKDAIVRVEAHRLRKRLSKYYEQEGKDSRIRIVLATGGYVPEFVVNEPAGKKCGSGQPDPAPPVPVISEHDLSHHASVLGTPEEEARHGPSARRRTLLARCAVLLAVFVLAALGVVFSRHPNAQASVPPRRGPNAAPGVFPGRDVRILAGLTTGSYIDRFGRTWSADHYWHGGASEPGPKQFYGRPPDAGLFATMRTGEFSYDVPVPPGVYELRLYWAEPIFRLENESTGGGENERRFNVSLNGKQLLSAFDVVADSGISPVDIRAFKDVHPAADGMVHLRFTPVYGTPFLNALELLPSTAGRALPIRIRAHELSFTDHAGRVWSPDDYYVGGRLATHKDPVSGAADPELYAGERYGNFNYVIPEPSGVYTVTLHFAETWFRPDSTGEDRGGKGDRIFDVYCNGTTLLKDFDIFAEAGPFHAVTRTFHGIRPNGQGKILLSFSPSKNYASIKAIEITSER